MSAINAPQISVRGLTLRVGNRTLAGGLHFDVAMGDRWVVLGPNGAGKSTLLATLAGIWPVKAGQVEVGGMPLARPLTRFDIEQLAGRRALVADRWRDPFAARVLETVLTARFRFGNTRMAGSDAGGVAAAHAALERFDVQHLAQRDVRRLSRGERQRVAIATALAQETPLLLLDEPIAHQDPRHQLLVLEALGQLADRTLVVSMHDVNAAVRFATHALLLWGDGRWKAGRAADLLIAAELAALFGTPFVALDSGPLRVLAPAAPGHR